MALLKPIQLGVLLAFILANTSLGRCSSILNSDESCPKKGFFRDKDDCTKFYRCIEKPHITHDQSSDRGHDLEKHEFTCPPDTIFDAKLYTCNFPERIKLEPGECQSSKQQPKKPNCVHGSVAHAHFPLHHFYYHPPIAHFPLILHHNIPHSVYYPIHAAPVPYYWL